MVSLNNYIFNRHVSLLKIRFIPMQSIIIHYAVRQRGQVCGFAKVWWKPRLLWQLSPGRLQCWVWCLRFLLTILCRFSMAFRSGKFRSTENRNTKIIKSAFAGWTGAKSCRKMKSATPESLSAEGSIKYSWYIPGSVSGSRWDSSQGDDSWCTDCSFSPLL